MAMRVGATMAAVVTAAAAAGYYALHDRATFYPGEWPRKFGDLMVIVKEEATNWTAHSIKLTVTWSPEDKVTGKLVEKHNWSTQSSREAGLKELEIFVKNTYASGGTVDATKAAARPTEGAKIGSEIREALKETVISFDESGKLSEDTVTSIPTKIKDRAGKEHSISVYRFGDIDAVVDEMATGASIRSTVLYSPNDKMNDQSFEGAASTIKQSRLVGFQCIETLACHYYKKV